MKIIIANDYEDMSRKAANYLSAQVIMKPDAVLGLATGETPIGAYKQLVEWYNKGDIDFSQTSTINLDEYKGLTGDHKQSYRYFMDTNLFDLINIKKSNTYDEVQKVTKIKIYDRPNTDDHITNSHLEFDDGTTLEVGELPNDGSVKEISLGEGKEVKNIKFVVDEVSESTTAVGLAEIEVIK